MIIRQYFTYDGTYGDARQDFAIINTTNFSAEERQSIEECSDNDRLPTALAINDYHLTEAGVDPIYFCDWEDLPDTVKDLQSLLESQWQDQEMQNAVVLIKRIAVALGV